MLGHEDLHQALAEPELDRRLVVTPLLDPEQVGPGTVDLRLGTQFLIPRMHTSPATEPFEESSIDEVVVPFGADHFIQPGQFILGATLEFVGMPPHLMGQVLNRSSWARQGLMVATAVIVQPGYGGCLTLELVNLGPKPLPLMPGSRIAQLVVWRLQSPTEVPYGESAKYVAPLGPQASRLHSERDERSRLADIARRMPLGRRESQRR